MTYIFLTNYNILRNIENYDNITKPTFSHSNPYHVSMKGTLLYPIANFKIEALFKLSLQIHTNLLSL